MVEIRSMSHMVMKVIMTTAIITVIKDIAYGRSISNSPNDSLMSGVSGTIVFHESHDGDRDSHQDQSNTGTPRGGTADDNNGNVESNNSNLNTINANNFNSIANSIDNSSINSNIILTELIQVENERIDTTRKAQTSHITCISNIDG